MANNVREQFSLVALNAFDPKTAEKSVVKTPSARENRGPMGPLVFNVASAADEFIPWGYNVRGRDAQLRNFWHTEPLLASAIYSMSARLSVVDWEFAGTDPTKPKPSTTIAAATRLLKNADYGQGWMSFITKVATDIYTQDNGAFIELVRREDSPTSPVIAINHLDSGRCFRTGDPEIPVRYQDLDGRYHELKWWHVVQITEMPSPIEEMFGVQYCAVTRALRAAQVLRDIAIYKKEKVSGQFMRTLHFVAGVTEDNINAALVVAKEQQLNLNLYRYSQPAIMATLDPDTTLQHVQIDLATLPDGFDEEITNKWYISQLALAFGVDYQEFAPLPGGNLGSGQQSEILHMKTRGKGPALLMSRIENIFNNFGILPQNIQFGFKVQDALAESQRATARFERGKDRAARVAAGELDAEGARDLAVLDGDLPDYLVESITKRQEERKAEEEAQRQEQMQIDQEMQQQKMQLKSPPVTMSDKQTQGGVNRQMRKSFDNDDLRAVIIRQLQREGVLQVRDEVMFTPEDIEAERQRLRDYFLGEHHAEQNGSGS